MRFVHSIGLGKVYIAQLPIAMVEGHARDLRDPITPKGLGYPAGEPGRGPMSRSHS